MKTPVGYGIDFGTSNSSVSIGYAGGGVEVLEMASGDMPHSLPSIAYLHRGGQRLAGHDAVTEYLITGSNRTACDRCPLVIPDRRERYSDCRQFEPGSFCNDARLIYGLKSELANDTFKKTHSWAIDFLMPDLVAVILSELKAKADRHTSVDVKRVVLGNPVAFVGTEGPRFEELQKLAEKRLVASAHAAGFDDVTLFEEPAAAIVDQPLDLGMSVCVDFGGGTFDVAVIEAGRGEAEVVALQGAAVGGSEFDALLFDHAVADQLGIDGRLPAAYRRQLRSLMGVRSLLSDKNLRAVLSTAKSNGARVSSIEEMLFGGHAYAFYKAIEDAKVALSISDSATIEFMRPGIAVRQTVARGEFEKLIEPHLQAVDRAITNALLQAEVDAADVHTVVRTGGSSEIPAFLDLVGKRFVNAEIRPLPVFTAVAEGLGHMACERGSDD